MNAFKILILLSIATFSFPVVAQAALLNATVSDASSENVLGTDSDADHTVNGTGLTGDESNGSTVGADIVGFAWSSSGIYDGTDYDPYIIFYLGGVCDVSIMRIWNYNSSIQLSSGNFSIIGADEVDVYTSLDGVTFTFAETLNFAQAPGTPGYAGEDIAVSYNNIAYIKFDIMTNHDSAVFDNTGTQPGIIEGRSLTGLSEVRFKGTSRGLMGHWKLDETTGNAATDSSASGYNGTLSGTTFDSSSVAGQYQTALSLDGIDDSVSLPALNLNTDTVTMTAWIKRNGLQGNAAGICFSRAGSTIAGLFCKGDELSYDWNGGASSWSSGLTIPDDQWVFVALVVEPTKATLYLDNGTYLLSSTHDAAHAVEAFDGATLIGADGDNFNGSIDDVRIFNYTLAKTAIQTTRDNNASMIRVMPLGDSITYGTAGGYRDPLYQKLMEAGYPLQFVGTGTAAGTLKLINNNQQSHEGHPGWVINGEGNPYDGIYENITAWMTSQNPDVITMMIGTNDANNDYDISGVGNRLDLLVTRIFTNKPTVKLLLATVIPIDSSTYPIGAANVPLINAQIPGIVANHKALGGDIQLVAMSGAVPTTDLPDGIHPNQTGYNKMSQVWFDALLNPDVDPNIDGDIDGLVDSWETGYFGNLGKNSSDDSDSDGVINGLEFALGMNPLLSDRGALPTAVVNGVNLDFTFNRVLAAPLVTYTVQSSTDLVDWTNVSVNPGTVGNPVTISLPSPIFMRLKIDQP